jgi:hypothetical protein
MLAKAMAEFEFLSRVEECRGERVDELVRVWKKKKQRQQKQSGKDKAVGCRASVNSRVVARHKPKSVTCVHEVNGDRRL